MRGFSTLLILSAVAALAQTPEPAAPPEVEQALRARVTQFYELQKEGKFRQTEQYVAEDTKDLYYAMAKTGCISFELGKISYSDDFTKATVIVRCERELRQPVIGTMTMKMAQETRWKLENGLWCWYVDSSVIRTPFGPMKSTTGQSSKPRDPREKGPSVADLMKMVAVDKTVVQLGPKGGSDVVVVKNTMPGMVMLSVVPPAVPGLEVKLERFQVGPKQSARVLFHYEPKGPVPATALVMLQIQPINETFPIQVKFEQAGQKK